MTLTNSQKKHYRSLGHNLNPIVTIGGNGLSEAVLLELNRALDDHELIKIKLAVVDRNERGQIMDKLREKTSAIIVQEIGKVALLFRAAKKPNPKLSNILR